MEMKFPGLGHQFFPRDNRKQKKKQMENGKITDVVSYNKFRQRSKAPDTKQWHLRLRSLIYFPYTRHGTNLNQTFKTFFATLCRAAVVYHRCLGYAD